MLEISKNAMVKLTYDLRREDEKGEMIEQATEEKPLQFIFGAGIMLPKFESELAGLKEGEPFTIRLNSNEAYGDVNQDAIVELPKQVFLVEGKFDEELISVGNVVPMMSSNGQRLNGVVLDVNDEQVKMDFNHPLAGEDLYFSGQILEVREATEDEIAQLGATGGCNCSSDDCSDDDCHSHDEDGCSGGCS